MKNIKQILSSKVFNVTLSIIWICLLIRTDSFLFDYILVAALFIYFYCIKPNYLLIERDKKSLILINLCSVIISFFIVLANYNILFFETNSTLNFLINIIVCIVMLHSGHIIFKNIILYLLFIIENIHINKRTNCDKDIKKIFAYCLLFVLIIYLFIFYAFYYPGNMSRDSIDQIRQIISNDYYVYHPIGHTLLIKACMNLAALFSSDINFQISFYIMFQIIIFSFSYAYCAVTLYEYGISMKALIFVILATIFAPFNFSFCFSVWKDALFGVSVFIFVIAYFRIISIKNVNTSRADYIVFFISSILFCIIRHNGLYAFIALTILQFIIFKKSNRKLTYLMLLALVIVLIFNKFALEYFDLTGKNLVHSLSIPLQQISRVIIYHGNDLLPYEKQLIQSVVNIDNIKMYYNPHVSDYFKNEIIVHGNQDFITNNIFEYIKLYISLGIKYPRDYIIAFIEQTKGFYNAGYQENVFYDIITANDYGISKDILLPSLRRAVDLYEALFFKVFFLQPFISIGFYTWIVLIICCINLVRNNKYAFFISLVLLFIIGTLIIATPVYCEFRYEYSVVLSLPFVIFCSLKSST